MYQELGAMTHNPLWVVEKQNGPPSSAPQQSVESKKKTVKLNDSNNFPLVGGARDVDMRNVGVVASDHACDQKPRRKQENRKKETKERGKRSYF